MVIHVLSLKEGAGKTALIAAMLNKWRHLPIAYVCLRGNSDGNFIRSLGIDVLPAGELKRAASEYKLVLVEGLTSQVTTEGKILLLAFYPTDKLEEVLAVADELGERVLGIVVNAVPLNRLKDNPWEKTFKERFPLTGLIPQDRYLFSPTIGEIGEVLAPSMKTAQTSQMTEEVVEHFMVGVRCLDPSPLYFGLRENKAVICRGDRPDMQLGALETKLKLLILTEGIAPHPYVSYMAESKGVPIMVVPGTTLTVMSQLEELTTKLRFHHPQKIARISKLIKEYFPLDLLERKLF